MIAIPSLVCESSLRPTIERQRIFVAATIITEEGMGVYAARTNLTAICVVDGAGTWLGEGKVATFLDAIVARTWVGALEKVGIETGRLAVWLWKALRAES